MATNDLKSTTDRRRFLASLASGAAAVGLATIPSVNLHAENNFISENDDDPELLFKNLKGKHRAVFDITEPNQENPMMPLHGPVCFCSPMKPPAHPQNKTTW